LLIFTNFAGDAVNWLRLIIERWKTRNLGLVCPHCKGLASAATFRRGRYMLGDKDLVCEECREASNVTLWRFEGLSQNSCLEMRDAVNAA
jgi:Zn ribbon nucleic-acid-binding protein